MNNLIATTTKRLNTINNNVIILNKRIRTEQDSEIISSMKYCISQLRVEKFETMSIRAMH